MSDRGLPLWTSPAILLLAVLVLLSAVATSATARDLDDPMRPTSTRPPPAPEPPEEPTVRRAAPPQHFVPEHHRLQEIYVMGSIRRARINNTWYEPGDPIVNGTIVDILPHAAVVEADDLFHMLYMNRERALFRSLKEAE